MSYSSSGTLIEVSKEILQKYKNKRDYFYNHGKYLVGKMKTTTITRKGWFGRTKTITQWEDLKKSDIVGPWYPEVVAHRIGLITDLELRVITIYRHKDDLSYYLNNSERVFLSRDDFDTMTYVLDTDVILYSVVVEKVYLQTKYS